MEQITDQNKLLILLLYKLQSTNNFDKVLDESRIVASNATKEEMEQAEKMQKQLTNYLNEEIIKMGNKYSQVALTPLSAPKVKRLYVDGCFDLMHSGHYNALRQAKSFTETLVVGVISQEEVTKRKGTPILAFEERLTLARSCKYVDEIYENAPYDASIELLDQLKCTHIGHGDDLIITPDGKDAYAPFKESNRMIIFKRTEGISTTDIVGRLLLMSKRYQEVDLNKNLRKLSGDQGVQASKIEDDQKGEKLQLTTVKMLNTTRRIRQFSSDLKEPKTDDKIVYIDGSYDLLHNGHIATLKNAKAMGDYLIVGLHDDETINSIKGSNYPILSLQERVLNVLAMKYVNEVIIGAPWKLSEQMIKQFGIQVVVEGSLTKGSSHFSEEVQNPSEDPYEIPKKLGIYKKIQSESTMTTEVIIERIVENRIKYLEIYNKKAKTQQTYYDTTERKVQEA